MKGAGRAEIVVSVILLAIIGIFVTSTAVFILMNPPDDSNFTPFIPFGYISIITSMGYTFMVFEGYEIVAQTGEEAKDPQRTIPRAMFLCIAISCIMFVAVAIVAIGAVGYEALAAHPFDAISYVAGISMPRHRGIVDLFRGSYRFGRGCQFDHLFRLPCVVRDGAGWESTSEVGQAASKKTDPGHRPGRERRHHRFHDHLPTHQSGGRCGGHPHPAPLHPCQRFRHHLAQETTGRPNEISSCHGSRSYH